MTEMEFAVAKQDEIAFKLRTADGSEKRALLKQARKIAELIEELS